MTRIVRIAVLASSLAAIALLSACATSRTAMAGRPMTDQSTGTPHGNKVREAKVEGYVLRYYVIDLDGASRYMTHHLMLYVTGPDGRPTPGGTATFKVTAHDQAEQTFVASFGRGGSRTIFRPLKRTGIPMETGYGADVKFKRGSAYTISTRLGVSGKQVVDEFEYTQG